MIRTVQGKGNISYLCVGSRIWPGDLQIILGRENTHRQRKKEKATKSQTHSTNRHWGVSMFMTLNSHLDSPHTHTHMQGIVKRVHMLWTTHCRADLFKSQELCLSFPTSCSQKYLWASCAVLCVFSVCICAHTYVSMCICSMTTNWMLVAFHSSPQTE